MTLLPLAPVSLLLLLLAGPATSQTPSALPFTSESLSYSVNWPSGLSLGEAHLRASKSDNEWQFEFSLDAAVPGFAVSDHYRSRANAELCSLELDKAVHHGKKSGKERTVFDYKTLQATRTTLTEGGGHTDMDIPHCAHDGLDFVYVARRELAQGRVPPQQEVLFGAQYSVRMEYTGSQEIKVNDKRRQTDRVVVYIKGPASDSSVEVFFARDPARTPLLIRAPFALGTFSMELVR
jgi:Protein of unknown function (DUF3108)